jgi:transposase InsO family protein
VPGVPHVELAQPRWGELRLSANGVWRVLRRHGLNIRAKRYGLVAGYVASAYAWATLRVTRRNPSARWTSQLARQVAADLASRGWQLKRVMTDNAQEFRSATFQATIAKLKAHQAFIRAGRPQTNGGGAGPADHLGRVLEAPPWPAI